MGRRMWRRQEVHQQGNIRGEVCVEKKGEGGRDYEILRLRRGGKCVDMSETFRNYCGMERMY